MPNQSSYFSIFRRSIWWAFWPSLKLGTALGSGVWLVLGVYVTRKLLKDFGWFEVTVSNSAFEPALIAVGAFIFLFIVRLLAAPYVLYRREESDSREKLLNAEARNEELERVNAVLEDKITRNKPGLIAGIESCVVGTPEGETDPATNGVFLNCTVKNLGAPSIADRFSCWIEREGAVYAGEMLTFPEKDFTLRFDNAPSIIIGRSDAIYNKTIRPIPQGGQERGWIYFIVRGLEKPSVLAIGSTVHLKMEDVEGTVIATQYQVTGAPSFPRYHPDESGGLKVVDSKVKGSNKRGRRR